MKESNLLNDFFESSDSSQGFYPMDEQALNKVYGGGFDTDTNGILNLMPDNNDLIS